MFAQIGSPLPIFRTYERLFRGHDGLMHALSRVFYDVMEFCTRAKDVFRKGRRRTDSLKVSRRRLADYYRQYCDCHETYMEAF